MVKQGLLIGTGDEAPWHPLSAVDGELKTLLAGLVELESTTDPQRLTNLEGTDLLICYSDTWETELEEAPLRGLMDFASRRGVLVIHNGVTYQKRPEFQALVGAHYVNHPPFTNLPMHAVGNHPILADLPALWHLDEEPYRFDDIKDLGTVLYEYEHEGARYPAAWAKNTGEGRFVFLMPGHHLPTFQHPEYRKLILSAVRWLLREL